MFAEETALELQGDTFMHYIHLPFFSTSSSPPDPEKVIATFLTSRSFHIKISLRCTLSTGGGKERARPSEGRGGEGKGREGRVLGPAAAAATFARYLGSV